MQMGYLSMKPSAFPTVAPSSSTPRGPLVGREPAELSGERGGSSVGRW